MGRLRRTTIGAARVVRAATQTRFSYTDLALIFATMFTVLNPRWSIPHRLACLVGGVVLLAALLVLRAIACAYLRDAGATRDEERA